MFRTPRYCVVLFAALASTAGGLALSGCSGESEPDGGAGGGGAPGGGAPGGGGAPQAGAATGGVSGMQGVAGALTPSGGSPPQGGTSGTAGAAPIAGRPNNGGSPGVAGSAGATFGGGAGTSAGGSSGGGSSGGGSANAGSAGMAGKASGGSAGSSGGSGGGASNDLLGKFSFFVASMKAMQTLAKSEDGFGGDLRFGKADGLSGADEICRQVAEMGMPGAGNKQWRAFLSAVGPPAVNARDRIGTGPWYDVKGRLVSQNLTDLLGQERPKADAAIANDLPNERGEPNHFVGPNGYTPGMEWDNHDTLTGSKSDGTVSSGGKSDTCQDWTSKNGSDGKPMLGHSWPRSRATGFGAGWASDHNAKGCAAGYYLDFAMPAGTGDCVGCGGGYGGIYCFAINQP